MPDWSMHELEDIVWEDSSRRDDHIVPCHSGTVNESTGFTDDGNNKPQHEVRATVGKITYSGGSVIHAQLWKEASFFNEDGSSMIRSSESRACEKAVPVLDPAQIPIASSKACQDAGNYGNYVKDCSMGTEVNDVGVLENEHKDGENDLIDYDWPDIGNFEDIDMLFRNCDTTFGQGSTVNTDELSWFSSSSHAIYGSEGTFESGLQSSCSQLSALNSTSVPYCANTNFMPEKDPRNADYDKCSNLSYQSYADWLDVDAENKGTYARNKEVNKQIKQLESKYLLPEKGKGQAVENTRIAHSHGDDQSEQCLQEVHDHLFRSQPMQPGENVETLHLRQQLYAQTHGERQSQKDVFATAGSFVQRRSRCQQEIENNNAKGSQTVKQPAVDIDSSTTTSVYSDDISVEATSFRQLQDAVDRLDVRTKICIRDGLYRLARSAEQRHSVAKFNAHRSEVRDRRVQGTEASENYAEFIDPEAETNPVDRSIARLLFDSPSEIARGLADKTMSLESLINIHAPSGME